MPQVASNDDVWNIVFSMIFTVGDRKITLPRSLISEVRSWQSPDPALELSVKQPSWLLGELVGKDERIPLISLEKFLGAKSEPRAKGRIVIVQSLSDSLAKSCVKPKFAFVCQGFPTLIEVRQPKEISAPLDEERINPRTKNFVAAEFTVGALDLMVPNFPAIEARLAAAYGVKPGDD